MMDTYISAGYDEPNYNTINPVEEEETARQSLTASFSNFPTLNELLLRERIVFLYLLFGIFVSPCILVFICIRI